MGKIDFSEEVGFVRPDALKEELSTKVIKVVDMKKPKNDEVVCPSYVTQYYG